MKKLLLLVALLAILLPGAICGCGITSGELVDNERDANYCVEYIFNSVIYTVYVDEVSFYYGSAVKFNNKTVSGNWIVTDLRK